MLPPGCCLILEAVHATHPGGKPLYAHALLWVGIVTLVTGLAHGVLASPFLEAPLHSAR